MKLVPTLAVGAALLFSLLAVPAPSPAAAPAAVKQLVKEKGAAVVALEVVLEVKSSHGGHQNEGEQRREALATIIDPSGLAVTALSNIDPGQFYGRMYGQEDSISTRIKSMKYILEDNTEIPAAVVLRDSDLDIVFIKPSAPAEKPFTAVDLANDAEAEVLDPAYTIGRMGRIGRRATLGMSGEIQAVVKGPRSFYIPSSELVTARTGVPIFNEHGKVLGIVAIYMFPGGNRALGQQDEPFTYAVIQAADIAANLEQAKGATPEPTAPPEDPADEEATSEEETNTEEAAESQ